MFESGSYIEELLRYSSETKSTDLHICSGIRPMVRINGKLQEIEDKEKVFPEQVDAILRSLLNDKKLEKLYENKVLDFSFSISGVGRFRANAYSQRGTYAIAIRMLPFQIPKFEELGLPEISKNLTAKSRGLILATGATGSGKSTTLASFIDLINENYNYHIITIEDPIEYLHRHKKSLVTQREIGEDCLSFSNALRSALREDPDVIMVGEMRDPETISIALTAAETGHLVLSTLHTVGASKSIDRIVDAFPPNQQNQIRSQLATVLEGIISQQLIPRIDRQGLALASELMFVNPAIRNLIREGKHYQIGSIMQTGQGQGMHLMEADLADLYNNGKVSKEEIFMRSTDHQLLTQFLNRR
ncbi:type IV pilus twitching motility protein PilT [Anaeropeptidivorans aminofermentans]|uniref:type IV pilus twitching motility protein PilT n=1 Tax=Anaeropeptidivorans aminofermentans TaxID=2934315 RepID=UPI002024A44A|nr:type IV pilus twitching motility protein PilT [Anaeropeptidivorans aminofermentans]MBE6012034.1 type IV pilus twitching motility protein PilT [Lachnospiraceae bacterium]